ncbi:MAG: glycerophosphodiester phosphodiesterase [Candidatus Binatia bacterium]
MPSRVLAIGHRGAAAHRPENTMPSFEKALELGADALEFDVTLSLDGIPVVIHDDTLDRTTDGRGAVEAVLLDDLRRLDAGKKKGLSTPIPTLAEVLDAFAHRTLLNLEMKVSPRREQLVKACVESVTERGVTGAVVFSSFDHDALRLLRRLLPEARIGVLAAGGQLEEAFACAAEIGAENLHPSMEEVTRSVVRRAHAAGLQVWTWTANSSVAIACVIDFGVDGIFSDWPERVVAGRGPGEPAATNHG